MSLSFAFDNLHQCQQEAEPLYSRDQVEPGHEAWETESPCY